MIEFEPMQLRDIPVVAGMSRSLVERGLGWSWRAPRVARNVSRSDTQGVVARDHQGECVGFMLVRHHDNHHAHVLLCAVSPAVRRQGVGRGLFAWFEPIWSMMEIRSVTLELRHTNEVALAFYESMGFVTRAIRPGYYQGREDAVQMAWARSSSNDSSNALNDRFDVFEWMKQKPS